MPRVFLSYSSQDRRSAQDVAARLTHLGAQVFVDYRRLRGGDDFAARIGSEISQCEAFVLLISPRAVESRWVQAEAAWALRCGKKIVPVILEEASLVSFFFVSHLHQIRWSDLDGEGATLELASALGLGSNTREARADLPRGLERDDDGEGEATPELEAAEIQELFVRAAELSLEDPEGAIFLYRQVFRADPLYLDGRLAEFLRSEEERLLPARLSHLRAEAETAVKEGRWRTANRLHRDLARFGEFGDEDPPVTLSLDVTCESIYREASRAAGGEKWIAVETLMARIAERDSAYGDPEGLLTGRPITAALAPFMGETGSFELPEIMIRSKLNFAAPGAVLVAGDSGSVLCIDASSGRVLERHPLRLWDRKTRILTKILRPTRVISSTVNALETTPDGSLAGVASDDGTIWLYALDGSGLKGTFRTYRGPVTALAFHPTRPLMASAAQDDPRILVWDLLTLRRTWVYRDRNSTLSSSHLCYTGDGNLVSATGLRTLRFWGGWDLERLHRTPGHSSVSDVAATSDGRYLIVGHRDGTVSQWELPEARVVDQYQVVSDDLRKLRVSPNGELMAVGTWNEKGLWICELPGGRALAKLEASEERLEDFAFSPDGVCLAAASSKNRICFFGLM